MHSVKIGVWAGISRRRIIGPIFFNETINGPRFKNLILDEFLNQLDNKKLQRRYFQQDGATDHTSLTNLRYLAEFFDDRVISKGLWAPRSPDLTPPDFFLWPYLKNRISINRMHTIQELKMPLNEKLMKLVLKP